MKLKKKEFFEQAIEWVKDHGFSNVRANWGGYESPNQFNKLGEIEPYVPDITGRKMAKKAYLEIALKTTDIARRVSKWKLLSTLATVKGSKLFLLVPKGHRAFVDRLIKQHHISAKIVALE